MTKKGGGAMARGTMNSTSAERPGSRSVGQVPMERLRSVFDGMFDGVWMVAADGRTTYSNGAIARLLGTTEGQMRGRPLVSYIDESERAEVEAFLQRQPTHAGERIPVRFRRQDDSFLVSMVAGSPITTEDGAYVGSILNVSDVTGKLAMDAQVIQNQRLEAIGQFAGGIAHDFNNLLTSIHGYAELARSSLHSDDPIREDMDHVLASAERAAAITRKLLAFTRRQILVSVDVDPESIVADLIPILNPLLGDNVELSVEVAPNHGWIRVDPTQFEQVIVNLTVNARDAMPLGGMVTISIHDVGTSDLERPDVQLNPVPFVRLSVADTGIGMDEATLGRAFDPFFTTKPSGQGTGLGLSVVSGIVAQSGGLVHVDTVLGQGSTFHVDLPRVDAAPIVRLRHVVVRPLMRTGVVLVVEDDPEVRHFVRRVLKASGYTVLVASSAGPALRAVERWGEKVDVLVTDIVMPGLNGLDMAARVRMHRPRIQVVFISGNSDLALGRERELSAAIFVSKPFTADELTKAVARAAEEGRSTLAVEPTVSGSGTRTPGGRGGRTGRPALSIVRSRRPESNPD
jgi:two-component system cell cycle sensor histidine kinase/response regulator CckA